MAGRRLRSIFLFLSILLGIWVAGNLHATAAGNPFQIHEETRYGIQAEEGRILVHTTIRLVNLDPTTHKRARGGYYYYNNMYWMLPHGVSAIRAQRADGTKLKVRRKKRYKEYDLYVISFRRQLTYHQKIRIELDYIIDDPQPPFYVSSNVVSVPVFQQRASSAITSGRVVMTFPKGFALSKFENARDCSADVDEMTVTCEGRMSSQPGGQMIVIEGTREAEDRELWSEPIPLEKQDVRIVVRFVTGEEAWAQKVLDVMTQALPELGRIHGFPYGGSHVIEVVRSSVQDIEGYAGMLMDEDTIQIQPAAPHAAMVHETAHLWSWPFEDVWLTEGWAEWSAREAIRRLEIDPESPPFRLPRRDTIKLPLQDWKHVGVGTMEDARVEDYGYAKAYDTMKRLVKLVGLATLQEANAYFAEVSRWHPYYRADSYAYLEYLLEHVDKKRTRQQVRKLWRNRVLNREGKALLAQRDTMWKALQKIEAHGKKLGWGAPQSLRREMLYWQFDLLKRHFPLAQETLKVTEETYALYATLGWQPDGIIQKRYEESAAWVRTLELARQRQELAQRAVHILAWLQAHPDRVDEDIQADVRRYVADAGDALAEGHVHQAEMLVNQAWKLMGAPELGE